MAYSSAIAIAIPKENNAIQKPPSDNPFDATQSLNPNLSESYVRFFVLLLWMLSHVSTPPPQPLGRREQPMGEIPLHRLSWPRQESSRAADLALSHHTISKSAPRPIAMSGSNTRVFDLPSILIARHGHQIRGVPKMQRLGQAIARRSQRISRSLRRSYLRRPRPGSDCLFRALKILASTLNHKQDFLLSQSLPSHAYFFGSFILKLLVEGSEKVVVDGDQKDFIDLLTLAVNQYASK